MLKRSVALRFAMPGLVLVLTSAGISGANATCNSGNTAKNFLLSSSVCQADARGDSALAVGSSAKALGSYSTAIGTDAGPNSSVVGATMIGRGTNFLSAGQYSIALGSGASHQVSARAEGGFSIAIGSGDSLDFPGPWAPGFRSISIGQKTRSQDFGTSVGFNTRTVFAATAIGTDSNASGDSSSAFGRFANATGASGVALGFLAQATHSQSVAIGSQSVTNAVRVVSVGSSSFRRRITNLAPALANSDATTLGQVKQLIAAATAAPAQTAQASSSGNDDLRRELLELRSVVQGLQQRIAELERGNAVARVD